MGSQKNLHCFLYIFIYLFDKIKHITKEISIQRLFKPGKENVSFSLKNNGQTSYIDHPAPDNIGSDNPIIFSHFHKDHCPQDKRLVIPPTFMNEQTLVILERIGAERSTFPNCSILKINEVNKIEGLGEVMPIPVSHSSVDALAFLITTDQGDTIFYSGDIRNGDRTSKALERVKKIIGNERVFLYIGDATGVGVDRISEKEHIKRLKIALNLSLDEKAPVSIYIKPGDYGNIAFWFREKVFESCCVFLNPKLQVALQNLDLLSFLERNYGFSPLSHEVLSERIKKRELKNIVYIYDDQWENIFRNYPHVLVNASRYDLPHKADNVIGLFPIGFSGHSGEAFENFLDVTRPKHLAFSHPPKKNKDIKLKGAKLVLPKEGNIFSF